MSWPQRVELPYFSDTLAQFSPWALKSWSACLSSGNPQSCLGRYDIWVAAPWATVETWGTQTYLRTATGVQTLTTDPLAVLRHVLGVPEALWPDLPFSGGALGYWGYELAQAWQPWLRFRHPVDRWPAMAVGLYDWAVVVDHAQARTWLVTQGRDPRTRQHWPHLLRTLRQPPAASTLPLPQLEPPVPTWDWPTYQQAFGQVQAHLQAGDCYQINLAQQFRARFQGEIWPLFAQLCQRSPAPFAAYLRWPHGTVISASPERFLAVQGQRVWTEPIKGTRPRSPDLATDAAWADDLCHSPKDRAENVMIVDLLRNDLGKVCLPGNIRVEALCELRRYAQVQHLVSRISGQLAPGQDAFDALRAMLPGGSVTGAPKRKAMEIIDQLEPARRGIYCGSIGYLSYDGQMDSNIAIRTLTAQAGHLHFWAGGGIVADSQAEAEYQECYAKAQSLLILFKNH